MDSGITAFPLTSFLADPLSGRAVVDRMYELLAAHKRVLVWGPRVGAIELAEDLLMLWPSDGEVVAVNPVGLCTRTRQDGQDSEWVQWVDTTAEQLFERVIARKPAGIVALYAGPALAPSLARLLGGPWGFVTAIDAPSAEAALARFTALAGPNAAALDVLVGLVEAGTSTFISEVRDASGARGLLAGLEHGKYILS